MYNLIILQVLPRPDIAVKEEKREINTRPSTDSIITSTVSLASGQDNGPVSMIVHNEIDKDKLMTVPPPSFVTGKLSLLTLSLLVVTLTFANSLDRRSGPTIGRS